ncbi:hypothetical protein KQX54_007912 [Cotesia glomerata]|uniref:Uncharacterized protein n=1 Tax=Cotesia glomerata TaxID=32391 RepID=A0AAV7IWS6_COTGL|nr:hypothetical protein KQX54_007912 [Cotesia glomerata]
MDFVEDSSTLVVSGSLKGRVWARKASETEIAGASKGKLRALPMINVTRRIRVVPAGTDNLVHQTVWWVLDCSNQKQKLELQNGMLRIVQFHPSAHSISVHYLYRNSHWTMRLQLGHQHVSTMSGLEFPVLYEVVSSISVSISITSMGIRNTRAIAVWTRSRARRCPMETRTLG